jgi:hypothetical protein
MTIGELFLRRVDQPQSLFRYSFDRCGPDGSSVTPPAPEPGLTLLLPGELPHVVTHREGPYLSPSQAIAVAMSGQPAGVYPVWAELGTSPDIVQPRHLPPLIDDPDRVLWVVVLAMGDYYGPKRAGHEHGAFIEMDAVTGSREGFGSGCCLDLLTGP